MFWRHCRIVSSDAWSRSPSMKLSRALMCSQTHSMNRCAPCAGSSARRALCASRKRNLTGTSIHRVLSIGSPRPNPWPCQILLDAEGMLERWERRGDHRQPLQGSRRDGVDGRSRQSSRACIQDSLNGLLKQCMAPKAAW
jgi:hypothetical protein